MSRANIQFHGPTPGGVKLVITFANNSADSHYFGSFADAHTYARDHVSYSSGAIKDVAVWPGDGSEFTLYRAGWNDESNRAAMALRW